LNFLSRFYIFAHYSLLKASRLDMLASRQRERVNTIIVLLAVSSLNSVV